MEKNIIKTYAIWARKELIERVKLKAALYGVTDKKIDKKAAESAVASANIDAASSIGVAGSATAKTAKLAAPGADGSRVDRVAAWLFGEEINSKRRALVKRISEIGFDATIEEIAYTWFNRFIALRFMEVNGYLKTRIFTDSKNRFEPEILDDPLNLDIPGLDIDRVIELMKESKRDELFNYLVVAQCNGLSGVLPGMFEKIDDYTELLIPENLLRDGSVIAKMVEMIPEDEWKNQVQIIGWLYQYYNSEVKEQVFEDLKKNIKITSEKIPAATQIFTPDWIVRYLVENSLGKLWMESHPESTIYKSWRYYLGETKQDEKVEEKLKELRLEYANIEPEDIKCIDPSVGSGHILCYIFDLLMEIYESYGYKKRDAVKLIIKKNICGLDIDERAKQLAYFSVMMKGLEYDKKFLERDYIPQPRIYTICESNYFKNEGKEALDFFINRNKKLEDIINSMVEDMFDACEYGSIIEVRTLDKESRDIIDRRFDEIKKEKNLYSEILIEKLLPLVNQMEILSSKYDVVVTNPPYIGSGGMNEKLAEFVKKNYYISRGDMFSVFMYRWSEMLKPHGFNAMVTMQSWMFLSGFEDFRRELFREMTISTLLHMDVMVMGIAFGTSATVFRNFVPGYKGIFNYIKRSDIKNGVPVKFPILENRYAEVSVDEFAKIPGVPVAFWAGENALRAFRGKLVEDYGVAKSGVQTGDNERFLRFWFEVDREKIAFGMKSKDEYLESGKKWVPQIKGGKYRKWYGNFDYVVNWENDGEEIKKCKGCRLNAMARDEYYFRPGLTWSHTTSGGFGMRYLPQGALFNVEAPTFFPDDENHLYYILGCLNSRISQFFLDLTNSTQHYLVGNILKLPLEYDKKISQEIKVLVKECIEIGKIDWDMDEISWDFKTSPLVKIGRMGKTKLEEVYEEYKSEVNGRFDRVLALEQRMGEIFVDLYGVEIGDVSPRDITVARIVDDNSQIGKDLKGNRYILTKADVIKNLISYGVGYLLGRFSLDDRDEKSGDPDAEKNSKIGIVPITDDEYFQSDIVTEFVDFIERVFGEENLEENLDFIASELKGKGSSREKIRRYFVNEFYKEHCKRYEKRPIYWQFDSGKQDGLKVLLYMHRYRPDSVARIRVDYVHEIQGKYQEELATIEKNIKGTGTSQRIKLNKKIADIKEKIQELEKFEEKIHHLANEMIEIDLDDGVKKNYSLFKDVVSKI